MLIDTHAHLTDEIYGGAKEIISSMKSDGLEKIITVAYDLDSAHSCVRLAEANENIYCAVGVHPDNSQSLDADPREELYRLSRSSKCVAIGEIGLDYHYESTQREKQQFWLERQLELVEQADLPVCFHVRDAYEDFYKIIKSNLSKIRKGAVVHCFSGSLETALQYIDLGFYISFTGSITFKNARKFPDIIKALPMDKILIETDCPYLAPTPHRGETNYPRFVAYQAQKIAEIREMDALEVERITTKNAYDIFTKMVK